MFCSMTARRLGLVLLIGVLSIGCGTDGATLVARDAVTGAVRWTRSVDDPAFEFGASFAGVVHGAGVGACGEAGARRSFVLASGGDAPTPSWDRVMVSGGVVATATATTEGIDLAIVDELTGAPRWSHAAEGDLAGAAAAVVATAHAGPGRDQLVAYDSIGGAERWRVTLGPGLRAALVSGQREATRPLIVVEPAPLALVARDPSTGAELWRVADGELSEFVTVIGERIIYLGEPIGSAQFLRALDRATGQEVWSRAATGHIAGVRAIGDHVFTNTAGELAALDLATGAPRWTATRAVHPQSLAADDVHVYAVSSEDTILAFDADTGAVAWEMPLPNEVVRRDAQVVAHGGLVLAARHSQPAGDGCH